jgi:hypothetical protein
MEGASGMALGLIMLLKLSGLNQLQIQSQAVITDAVSPRRKPFQNSFLSVYA